MADKGVFETLNAKDVSAYTEGKDAYQNGRKIKLNYLSWANAWKEVKKAYPDANYEIRKFDNNLPYVFDPETGYMVFTSVTIEGQTHEMWLPVMDNNNQAMKSEPYTITFKSGKSITIDSATMFDVNKTIMRCLTKNLAMFGLGLYIYAGEDLPDDSDDKPTKQQPKKQSPRQSPPKQTPQDAPQDVKNAKAIETAKYIAKQSSGAWGKEKGQEVYNALKEHYRITAPTEFDPDKVAEYIAYIVNHE